jgi:hypothetical protein
MEVRALLGWLVSARKRTSLHRTIRYLDGTRRLRTSETTMTCQRDNEVMSADRQRRSESQRLLNALLPRGTRCSIG